MRRLKDLSNTLLYAVTSEVENESAFFEKVDQLLAGGVDVIQFRSKKLSDQNYLRIGSQIKLKCEMAGAIFIVNNRADLAAVLDADGVHLGHKDLPIEGARKILGYEKIIGASAHSVVQALAAQKAGADYVSCGPIWATPTKPDYEAVGLGLIDLYRASIQIPFFVIGGVNEQNVDEILAHGAKRVAVVRALFDSPDPFKAAQVFRKKMESNWKADELNCLQVMP